MVALESQIKKQGRQQCALLCSKPEPKSDISRRIFRDWISLSALSPCRTSQTLVTGDDQALLTGSLTHLLNRRRHPTMEDFKKPSRAKNRDTYNSFDVDDEMGDGTDGQRPEFVKDYLVKRGFDPLKPLPERVEWALRTEVARLHIIRVNPDLDRMLLCFEETVMPPSKSGAPFCNYFAETDSIHVPIEISRGGAYDIPMSGDWRNWVDPPKAFWIERKEELELLWTAGRLVKRDVDRWGRPWGPVHAGLGKKPASWSRREEICVFYLNSGGSEKRIEPYWREGKPDWVTKFRFEKLVPLREERLAHWLEIELRSRLKIEHK